MAELFKGRMAADIDEDVIVFMIGMRVNKPWKIHKWAPIARSMTKMQINLAKHPELGCLAVRNWFGLTTISLQYWRSFEDLERFARDTDLPHLEPWRDFNRRVRDSGDVGIWHETYQISADRCEGVYIGMPRFGLAHAGHHLPASEVGDTAARRLGATEDDAPPIPTY